MKGIILAGGSGTRLYPMTKVINKQLLPVYDKPMIFYPLSTLMLAGIMDILIITTKDDLKLYEKLLGTGRQYGIKITYAIQEQPNGLAQAFVLGESFLNGEAGALILGDNIFYGKGFKKLLTQAMDNAEKNGRATVFGYYVSDPERFGVVAFDKEGKATSIEEKPMNPQSNYAVTGLYFYPTDVSARARQVKPGKRGEYEITSLNAMYLDDGLLDVKIFEKGFSWLDTGTMQSMLQASIFVESVRREQGILVGSPEVIAYKNGFIDKNGLMVCAKTYESSEYGEDLKKVAEK